MKREGLVAESGEQMGFRGVSDREEKGLRFVDDSHDVESCNDSSIFGGLSLGIIKVGGDRYHGVGDLVTQVCLRRFLKYKRRVIHNPL